MEYERKRTFDKTPEPKAKKKNSKADELIFVIQKHFASHLHFDVRLELFGVLKSWAVPKGPPDSPKEKRLAIMVEDHPYAYKDFFGEIPKGSYGAGTVEIWDYGTYQVQGADSKKEAEKIIDAALKKGHLTFFLKGQKLHGEYAFVRLSGGQRGNEWLLIKAAKDDNASTPLDPIDPLPLDIAPMLPTLIEKPFNGKEWLFELKWDGYRALTYVHKGQVAMISRNNLSFNERFSPLVEQVKKSLAGHSVVLDGEVVTLDEKGRCQFQLMQNYLRTRKGNLYYYVFDLLYLDGKDLRKLPLIDRKCLLEGMMGNLLGTNILYSDHEFTNGVNFFEKTKKYGVEGMVAKKIESPYAMGRTREWLKVKSHLRQEMVIGGFTESIDTGRKFRSLLVGVYQGKELIFVGHVGGGFAHALHEEVYAKLKKIIVKQSPFANKFKANATPTFVKPILVCEVSFAEWTSDNSIRQPIFMGLRLDKKPKDIQREYAQK